VAGGVDRPVGHSMRGVCESIEIAVLRHNGVVDIIACEHIRFCFIIK
jgi:hypothetical protein